MTEEIFERILANLHENNYPGNLHLYLMGEPLCDSRIHNWIKKTRELFSQNSIFISTNGDYLNGPGSVKALFDSGLTWMAISDYDKKGKFSDYTAIFPRVVVTTKNQLEETFYNRGGNIDVECPNPNRVCDWVFGKAYINYRGDVILCCSDYQYEIIFGNVMDKPFSEIYNCEQYRFYRKEHAAGRGKILPLCDRCNRIQ